MSIFAVKNWVAAVLLATATCTSAQQLVTPEEDRRGEEQTWLTFPEWFLVFSPAEYADLLETRASSEFPWFGHIGEFWKSYGAVIDATDEFEFNGEYHTMINVIGVSTTIEYGLKGAYETLVGRLTELTAAPNATAEDRLAARVARDYVDFVRVRPWYEFDFVTPLRELWSDTPAGGDHLIRKWERRYLLTSEWAAKAGYAWALGLATGSTFEKPKITTLSWVSAAPDEAALQAHGIEVVQRDGEFALLALPRYQGFTDAATWLAAQGTQFIEIAGNRGPILVSVVSPAAQPMPAGADAPIRQSLSTKPGFERRVLRVDVGALSDTLAEAARNGDSIEHVFDY